MKDVSITEHNLYIKYCKNNIKNEEILEKHTTSLPCWIFKKIKIFLCNLSYKIGKYL